MLLRSNSLSHPRAFSLFELMITLVILAILTTVTIPSLQQLLAQNHTAVWTNRLITALNFARATAINNHETIKLCKSLDGEHCGGQWRDGQIMLDNKNTLLHSFAAFPAVDKLVWNSSAGKDDYIEFVATGFTNGQRGSFYYCHQATQYSRVLVLNHAGRWYVRVMQADEYVKYCR